MCGQFDSGSMLRVKFFSGALNLTEIMEFWPPKL